MPDEGDGEDLPEPGGAQPAESLSPREPQDADQVTVGDSEGGLLVEGAELGGRWMEQRVEGPFAEQAGGDE